MLRIVTVLTALILTPAVASAQSPLQGVWSMISVDPGDGSSVIDPSQPGLYIFAGGHYSAVYAAGPEPRERSAS